MCESIGHRPLQGRCPKRGPTDQPTNRQTDIVGCRGADWVEALLLGRVGGHSEIFRSQEETSHPRIAHGQLGVPCLE